MRLRLFAQVDHVWTGAKAGGYNFEVHPKRLVAISGCAVALVGCSSGHHSTVPTPVAPVTTNVTATASAPTTTAPKAPVRATSVGASPSTGVTLSGAGSTLTAPQAPTVRTAPSPCALVDAGFKATCAQAAPLVGIVELPKNSGNGSTAGERDLVWRATGNNGYTLVLRATPAESPDQGITVINGRMFTSALLTNPSRADLVYLSIYDNKVQPYVSALDVIRPNGTVGLHRDLHKGDAEVSPGKPGKLATWTPDNSGAYDKATFGFRDGSWTITGVVHNQQLPVSHDLARG